MAERIDDAMKIRSMFAGSCDELSNGKKGYRKFLEDSGKLSKKDARQEGIPLPSDQKTE